MRADVWGLFSDKIVRVKVLMIAPTPFFSHRGTHIRILEEARALERQGHAVMIVTYHNGDDIAHHLPETTIDVRRIRRWLFWYKKTEAGPDWQKVILNLFLIRKTYAMIREWRPDVVHAHLHEGVLIARLMKMIFFRRRFVTVSDFHGSLVGEMRSHGYLGIPPLGTIFRALERWIDSMGDVAIVSSEENRAVIAGARADGTATHVPDGVDVATYDAVDADTAAQRTHYGIPRDALVVVYTGALIPNKGIAHVIDAIAPTVQAVPHVHFVIGGFPDGWVRDAVHARGMDDHVTIVSPLNYFALPRINALADIAVDPKDVSVRQASGKILHYMAARTGIICADRPTNHTYLRPRSATFLPRVDATTICDAIVRYDADRRLLATHAADAYRDAHRWDWRVVGKQLITLYDESIKHQRL